MDLKIVVQILCKKSMIIYLRQDFSDEEDGEGVLCYPS